MKIGTRSILFGVHAFWWHPLTVLYAWWKCYGCWPNWWQTIAIFCHDLGYWGRSNIDGYEGKEHPYDSAHLAARIIGFFRGEHLDDTTYRFVLFHSRDIASELKHPPSPLCWADKASIFYDPSWFYLFRGRLSGEIAEFKQRAVKSGHISAGATDRQWLKFYRSTIRNNPVVRHLI